MVCNIIIVSCMLDRRDACMLAFNFRSAFLLVT